jgi:hypothetical protein
MQRGNTLHRQRVIIYYFVNQLLINSRSARDSSPLVCLSVINCVMY